MKKILWVLLALVAVALGVGGFLYKNLDALARSAIEQVGTKVLQVPVKVGGVHLSPTDGAGTLTDFSIGNPTGFKAVHALTAGEITLAVEPKTLTADVIRIRRIEARNVAIDYESVEGGTNFDVIKRNAERFAGADKQKDAGAAKKFIIDSLIISGAKVSYAGGATFGKPLELTLPDVALRDIGARQGGVTADRLASVVLDALMRDMGRAVSNAVKGAAKSIGSSVMGIFGK